MALGTAGGAGERTAGSPAGGRRARAGTNIRSGTLLNAAKEAVARGMNLKQAMAHARQAMDPKFGHVFIYEHCLPFDVTRAVDEASGIKHPRIWTAERDREMWHGLQAD